MVIECGGDWSIFVSGFGAFLPSVVGGLTGQADKGESQKGGPEAKPYGGLRVADP